MTEVEARVRDVMRKVFYLPALTLRPCMTAQDVVEWDSLAHLNLIAALEREFACEFDLDELEGMATVKALLEIISRKVAS